MAQRSGFEALIPETGQTNETEGINLSGTGIVVEFGTTICRECDGTGLWGNTSPCVVCDGLGRIDDEDLK